VQAAVTLGNYLSDLVGGPAHLRFIVQPLVALLLGVRDGHRDAKAGEPPFVLMLVLDKERRGSGLRLGLRRILVPLVVAVILDGVVQEMIFSRVRPLAALFVGVCLIGLPYAACRGLSNRLLRRRVCHHQ
jgi:hypothetical protein